VEAVSEPIYALLAPIFYSGLFLLVAIMIIWSLINAIVWFLSLVRGG
jgi:hypothetical protein